MSAPLHAVVWGTQWLESGWKCPVNNKTKRYGEFNQGFVRVYTVRQTVWRLRDSRKQCQETVSEMALCRNQLPSLTRNRSSCEQLFNLSFFSRSSTISGSLLSPLHGWCCEVATRMRTRWWWDNGRTNWTKMNRTCIPTAFGGMFMSMRTLQNHYTIRRAFTQSKGISLFVHLV